MDMFTRSWKRLLAAATELADESFMLPSGCAGWLVRDLVCHLVIDAQDVLITLATPANSPATHTAVTYWSVTHTLPSGQDPLTALTTRLATAYKYPELLRNHLADVGWAAARAAELADPDGNVETQDMVVTAREYLSAFVLESTLHHLDLIRDSRVPAEPPALESLAWSRQQLEQIAGWPFPADWPHHDVLLVGTGRREPDVAEIEQLGPLSTTLPIVLS